MCLAKLSNFGVQQTTKTAGESSQLISGWAHACAQFELAAHERSLASNRCICYTPVGEVEDTMTAGEGSRGVLPALRVVAWMVVVARSTGTHSAHTDRPAIVVRVRVHGNTCE